MSWFHTITSYWLKKRLKNVEYAMAHPSESQEIVLNMLLKTAQHTTWGKQFGFQNIRNIDQYRQSVPVQAYEALFPYIERVMKGENNLLWPGKTKWFAKSSGTTNDRSKYIPVSKACLYENHYACGKDMLALYLASRPASRLFNGKILSMGGSLQSNPYPTDAKVGDISAVIMQNLNPFYQYRRAPAKAIALMSEWESKIAAILQATIDDHITGLAGVPTWIVVLLNRMLAQKKISDNNMLKIWKNFEVFFHGAVNFEPYRAQFAEFFPSPAVAYRDVYNASEGFIAVQNEDTPNDLLLLTNRGIFYEFIPMDTEITAESRSYWIDEIEIGKNYALVLSTNGGLWRYLIGDTIKFTSKSPPKIRITGRTKQFLNAFGEELVVENAEIAIAAACLATQAQVVDYTAAPHYFQGKSAAAHEWAIAFSTPPNDIQLFQTVLDRRLREINSDYDAKRHKNIALQPPIIHILSHDIFLKWLKQRNKLGGQHKVPRLSNDRKVLEEILQYVKN